MTQLFFQEFVSQLWRLNSITKLEEINFSLCCHLLWKDGCWQAPYLYSDKFWTAVQKHPELLLSCSFLGHQTLLWQEVTALIFSRKLHCVWWSGGNKGGKSLQNKITAGEVSRMWWLHITWKCKRVTSNVLIFFCRSMRQGCTILVVLEGSATEHIEHWTDKLPQAVSQHLTTQLITLVQDNPSLR